ncbi:hypothetical protein D3C85_1244880 [compost metagenome]
MGVDPRVLHPHILPGNPDLLPKLGGNKEHNRHCNHYSQPQLPVDQQQNHHNADKLHAVNHQIDDPVRKQILQGVDIICHPHQYRTSRPFIEKVERELLDMPEEIRAQIVNHPLSNHIRILNPVDSGDPLDQVQHNHAGRQCIQKGKAGIPVLRSNCLINGHTR